MIKSMMGHQHSVAAALGLLRHIITSCSAGGRRPAISIRYFGSGRRDNGGRDEETRGSSPSVLIHSTQIPTMLWVSKGPSQTGVIKNGGGVSLQQGQQNTTSFR